MKEPLVTILLPAYNAERFIEEAIASILAQTYRNFVLLIINDGSSDKTESIVENQKDDRIQYVKNESNIGLIKTLNKGILLARGKYIARMDADDICAPERIQQQVSFLEKNKDYVMCGSWAKIIDNNGLVTGRMKRINSHALIQANMLFTTPFIHPSVLIRKEVLLKEKYSEEALHCEDLELWVRLSRNKNYRFANIPNFLLKYRWHDQNISVQNDQFQSIKRKEIIKPYILKLIPEATDKNIDTHFSLFGSNKTNDETLNWVKRLLKENDQKNEYDQNSLKALLASRLLITNIKSRNLPPIFFIFKNLINPSTFVKVCKLLIYK